ncbi:MAG: hypothetical protein LQ340_003096 [Diploschistes diacapsis]|nr:MAG: hypothetical protein LQ340_003096 [Diploschistes diacapsis]
MTDAPPPGPPPPKVPEGWKAVWNSQYSEWFYVNVHTRASQWDKPTAPVSDPNNTDPLFSPPPAYTPSTAASSGALSPGPHPTKGNPNNPYGQPLRAQTPNDIDADARLAAQLQAEEEARAAAASGTGRQPASRGPGGAADSYYTEGGANRPGSGYGGGQPNLQPQPEQPQKRGLLDKLTGRSHHYQGSFPAQQQGQGGQDTANRARGLRPNSRDTTSSSSSSRGMATARARRRRSSMSSSPWCSRRRQRRRSMAWEAWAARCWAREAACWAVRF